MQSHQIKSESSANYETFRALGYSDRQYHKIKPSKMRYKGIIGLVIQLHPYLSPALSHDSIILLAQRYRGEKILTTLSKNLAALSKEGLSQSQIIKVADHFLGADKLIFLLGHIKMLKADYSLDLIVLGLSKTNLIYPLDEFRSRLDRYNVSSSTEESSVENTNSNSRKRSSELLHTRDNKRDASSAQTSSSATISRNLLSNSSVSSVSAARPNISLPPIVPSAQPTSHPSLPLLIPVVPIFFQPIVSYPCYIFSGFLQSPPNSMGTVVNEATEAEAKEVSSPRLS